MNSNAGRGRGASRARRRRPLASAGFAFHGFAVTGFAWTGLAYAGLAALLAPAAAAQNGDRPGEDQSPLPPELAVPPAPVLTPEEALAAFRVHDGFRVELVAAEPLVRDPVDIAFDERGRLWVVEMSGYMRDATGKGEREPLGVVAVLTDEDGDGRMDARRIFAEGLVLPRSVHPCEGGALVVAPPELLFLADRDGDGALDEREVVDTGLDGLENPEHAVNGLLYGLDNWYHLANWREQYRRVDGTWRAQRSNGGGQWGLAQDDVGRLFFNTNSDPLRADVVPSEYALRNPHQRGFLGANVRVASDMATWPARITPGVNRGYQEGTLRADFTLAKFTAACSPLVDRGSALGAPSEGDVFVCEPAANLVKRYRLTRDESGIGLAAKPIVVAKHDFLTSTDERFRPVALANGPDGALYVADFHRGIIQHRIYMTSFLRRQVEDRGLAEPLGLGRIFRVVREDARRHAVPDLAEAGFGELVAALAHPSGTVRDHAQRLIVEDFRGEADVAAQLRSFARAASDPRARVHSLWTLAGIGELDPEVISAALHDADARVRHAALRVAEPWLGLQGNDLVEEVRRVALAGTDPWVRHQAILSLGAPETEAADAALAELAGGELESPHVRSAFVSGLRYRELAFLRRLAADPRWRDELEGRKKLLFDLAACIGREGASESIEAALRLAFDPPHGAVWWCRPIAEGLASARGKGPAGELRPLVLSVALESLAPAASGGAKELALALEASRDAFTWPGKPGAEPIVPPRELTEEESLSFARGSEVYATACAVCHQPHGAGEPGKAPSLRGTEWVLGDPGRLARILLHGLEGPLELDGETWDQEMPRFEGTPEDIAAVATFVRRSFGNGAEPVSPEFVREVAESTKERRGPFKADELR